MLVGPSPLSELPISVSVDRVFLSDEQNVHPLPLDTVVIGPMFSPLELL